VERAWRSADRIKPYISKWYKSHSQVLQMLISGEVDVACTLGPYATMHKWEGAPVDVEYNQGKLASDNWCIIKGARHKEAAYKLINYMLDAKRQACYVSKVPHGPTNMESIKYVDPEIRKDLNTSPQNRAKAYWHNVRWWAELGPGGKSNRQKAIERYNKWLVK